MSVRYFKTRAGVAQYGNLTDDGAAVLVDSGHEEITAEEYQQAQEEQATAVAELLAPASDAEQEDDS